MIMALWLCETTSQSDSYSERHVCEIRLSLGFASKLLRKKSGGYTLAKC